MSINLASTSSSPRLGELFAAKHVYQSGQHLKLSGQHAT